MAEFDSQMKRGLRSYLISAFFFMALLLVVSLTVVYLYLPTYLEKKVLPDLFASIGAAGFSGEVRRIGLTGADLGALTIGGNSTDAIAVESVRVYYSPAGLLKKRIDSLVVGGLEINCAVTDKGLEIKGLEQMLPKKPDSSGDSSGLSAANSFSINNIQVRNSVLVVDYQGQSYQLPFEVLIIPQNPEGMDKLRCVLTLYPYGQQVLIVSTIDFSGNRAKLNIVAESLHLDRFGDLAAFIPGLELVGEAGLSGYLDIKLKPLQLNSSDITCKIQGARLGRQDLVVKRGNEESALIITASNKENKWQVGLAGLSFASPVPLQIPLIKADLESSDNAIRGQGEFIFKIAGQGTEQPLISTGSFFGKYIDGTWDFELLTDPDTKATTNGNKYRAKFGTLDLVLQRPGIKLAGHGDKSKWLAGFDLDLPAVSIDNGNVQAEGALSFIGSMESATADNISACPVQTKGVARLKNAEAVIKDKKIAVKNIRAEIPLQWPIKNTGEQGSVVVGSISRDGTLLGSLESELRQKDRGLTFQGKHESALVRSLTLNFNGRAGLNLDNALETEVFFNVPSFYADSLNLADFSPGAAGMVLDGNIGLNGYFSSEAGINTGAMRAELKDSKFEFKDKGLTVEGIDLSLSLPSLPDIRSAPQQKIAFNQANLGDLSFDDGIIEFQIESPDSIFIEKSLVGWSKGHLSTQALRIKPGISDYSFVVYCDRLKLSKILEQFGAVNAEGEGAVNGIIPMTIKGGRLNFNDGFLYSTPGEGGSIRVTGADMLAAGIPKNTPQFSQIDFAMEALKDFNYKWVKLYLLTEDDDLLLQMRLDGKPGKPLPFYYERELGTFVRLKAESKGGIYQTIRLDANFRLPLNQFLDYSDSIQDVIDRIKQ